MSSTMIPLTTLHQKDKSIDDAQNKSIVVNYLPWDDVSLDDDDEDEDIVIRHNPTALHDNETSVNIPETNSYTASLQPTDGDVTRTGIASKQDGSIHHLSNISVITTNERKAFTGSLIVTLDNASDDVERGRGGFDPDERSSDIELAPSCCGFPVTFCLLVFGFFFPVLWFVGSFWITSRHLRVRIWAWGNFSFALTLSILAVVLGIKYGR
ncbi:hypothetical protein BDF22DRAFT_701649 [Syncephalis plumigaleata]|nr:hypothetical protein BDF22DRAFT_701649 [Syncephalis plumigaleata]